MRYRSSLRAATPRSAVKCVHRADQFAVDPQRQCDAGGHADSLQSITLDIAQRDMGGTTNDLRIRIAQ